MGEQAVETLRIGDLVQTSDHGYQPIRWAGSKSAIGQGRYAPILFPAGSVENTRDLWLSRQHRVLVDDDMVKSELDCDASICWSRANLCRATNACSFVSSSFVWPTSDYLANGTAVESLYLGEQVVDMFQAEDLSSVPQRISPAN